MQSRIVIATVLILFMALTASAANNISVNNAGSSTQFDTSSTWTEISGSNLSLATGAGTTVISGVVDAKVNYTLATLYLRILHDGNVVTTYNMTQLSYLGTQPFSVAVSDTEGNHSYALEVMSTAGRKATIYRWNMSAQFLSTGEFTQGGLLNPATADLGMAGYNITGVQNISTSAGKQLHNLELPYTHIIVNNSGTIEAINGSTYAIDHSSTNAANVVQDTLKDNSNVFIKDSLVFTGGLDVNCTNCAVSGMGIGNTVITGNTNQHVVSITGTNVSLRDVTIDGGNRVFPDNGVSMGQAAIIIGKDKLNNDHAAENVFINNVEARNVWWGGMRVQGYSSRIFIDNYIARNISPHLPGLMLNKASDVTIGQVIMDGARNTGVTVWLSHNVNIGQIIGRNMPDNIFSTEGSSVNDNYDINVGQITAENGTYGVAVHLGGGHNITIGSILTRNSQMEGTMLGVVDQILENVLIDRIISINDGQSGTTSVELLGVANHIRINSIYISGNPTRSGISIGSNDTSIGYIESTNNSRNGISIAANNVSIGGGRIVNNAVGGNSSYDGVFINDGYNNIRLKDVDIWGDHRYQIRASTTSTNVSFDGGMLGDGATVGKVANANNITIINTVGYGGYDFGVRSIAPDVHLPGDRYYNSATHRFYVANATGWAEPGAFGSSATSDLDMNLYNISAVKGIYVTGNTNTAINTTGVGNIDLTFWHWGNMLFRIDDTDGYANSNFRIQKGDGSDLFSVYENGSAFVNGIQINNNISGAGNFSLNATGQSAIPYWATINGGTGISATQSGHTITLASDYTNNYPNSTLGALDFNEGARYYVYQVGSTTYAKNGTTGEIEWSATNSSPLQDALDRCAELYRACEVRLLNQITASEKISVPRGSILTGEGAYIYEWTKVVGAGLTGNFEGAIVELGQEAKVIGIGIENTNASGDGILFNHSQGQALRNDVFAKRYGIYDNAPTSLNTVENKAFENRVTCKDSPDSAGVFINTSTDDDISFNIVRGCDIGFRIGDGSAYIKNNHAYKYPSSRINYSVYGEYVSQINLWDNFFEGNPDVAGIYIKWGNIESIIRNNIYVNTSADGIYIHRATLWNSSISSNEITSGTSSNGDTAINLTEVTDYRNTYIADNRVAKFDNEGTNNKAWDASGNDISPTSLATVNSTAQLSSRSQVTGQVDFDQAQNDTINTKTTLGVVNSTAQLASRNQVTGQTNFDAAQNDTITTKTTLATVNSTAQLNSIAQITGLQGLEDLQNTSTNQLQINDSSDQLYLNQSFLKLANISACGSGYVTKANATALTCVPSSSFTLNAQGYPTISSAAVIAAGGNISLGQSGNTITITSTGSYLRNDTIDAWHLNMSNATAGALKDAYIENASTWNNKISTISGLGIIDVVTDGTTRIINANVTTCDVGTTNRYTGSGWECVTMSGTGAGNYTVNVSESSPIPDFATFLSGTTGISFTQIAHNITLWDNRTNYNNDSVLMKTTLGEVNSSAQLAARSQVTGQTDFDAAQNDSITTKTTLSIVNSTALLNSLAQITGLQGLEDLQNTSINAKGDNDTVHDSKIAALQANSTYMNATFTALGNNDTKFEYSWINYDFDNTSNIITNMSSGNFSVPNGTIVEVRILSNSGNGSVNISAYKSTPPDYPPNTLLGSIVLSSSNYVSNTTLSGWNIALAEGDVVNYKVNSADLTSVTVSMKIRRL